MADYTDKPGYAFGGGPPSEVTAFLKGKENRVSFSWRDVEPQEHAVAFTVAKAMKMDVLEAIRGELEQALEQGIPLAEFQKRLRPRLEALGWWGRKEVTDPETGDTRKAQLGSARRLRTIYRSNMRAARAAGQWDRIERTKAALPYLIYQLGPSERHRPAHVAQEGKVLPIDSPFWEHWMPPNGWGCKCHVRQITRAEAERRGIAEEVPLATREVFNPRTGERKRVPQGIDPAWDGNPGLTRQKNVEGYLAGRLDAAPPDLARAAIHDILASWRFQRLAAAPPDRAAASVLGKAPVALVPAPIAEELGASTRVVHLSGESAGKQRKHHPDISAEDYRVVQEALERGRIVAEGPFDIAVEVEVDGKWWRAAIKRTAAGGELYLKTLHRIGARQAQAHARRVRSRVMRDVVPGGS